MFPRPPAAVARPGPGGPCAVSALGPAVPQPSAPVPTMSAPLNAYAYVSHALLGLSATIAAPVLPERVVSAAAATVAGDAGAAVTRPIGPAPGVPALGCAPLSHPHPTPPPPQYASLSRLWALEPRRDPVDKDRLCCLDCGLVVADHARLAGHVCLFQKYQPKGLA